MREGGNVPFTIDGKPVEARLGETILSVGDFQDVELTMTEQAALAEAGRCLRCDLEALED
jgi:hypothetical protein